MATSIFKDKTSETVQSILGTIKLITIVGGDETSDKPGRSVDEELNLYIGDDSKKLAGVCIFLWSRFNGIPFERASLDSLIKALRKQRVAFKRNRNKQLNPGRPSNYAFTAAELNKAISRFEAQRQKRRAQKDASGQATMRSYVNKAFWVNLATEIRPGAPLGFASALRNTVYRKVGKPKKRR